jgi:hypothetical protein
MVTEKRLSNPPFRKSLPVLIFLHAAHFRILKKEAVGSSEIMMCIYQTTRCHRPEDRNVDTWRRKKLKSYYSLLSKICWVLSEGSTVTSFAKGRVRKFTHELIFK